MAEGNHMAKIACAFLLGFLCATSSFRGTSGNPLTQNLITPEAGAQSPTKVKADAEFYCKLFSQASSYFDDKSVPEEQAALALICIAQEPDSDVIVRAMKLFEAEAKSKRPEVRRVIGSLLAVEVLWDLLTFGEEGERLLQLKDGQLKLTRLNFFKGGHGTLESQFKRILKDRKPFDLQAYLKLKGKG